MTGADARALPDVGEVLAPILLRVAREEQPLLLAIAERMAAVRYRRWTTEREGVAHRDALLACAEREERIARAVEALRPDAAAVQADLRTRNPDLGEIDRSLFAGRPLRDQLAIQARGERLGAATWRAFSAGADAATREAFAACARLEEENAAALEAILAADR